MKLFTIYDKIAGESGPLFEAKNEQVAIRQYDQLISQQEDILSKDDFQLMCVGEYDHETMDLLNYSWQDQSVDRVIREEKIQLMLDGEKDNE